MCSSKGCWYFHLETDYVDFDLSPIIFLGCYFAVVRDMPLVCFYLGVMIRQCGSLSGSDPVGSRICTWWQWRGAIFDRWLGEWGSDQPELDQDLLARDGCSVVMMITAAPDWFVSASMAAGPLRSDFYLAYRALNECRVCANDGLEGCSCPVKHIASVPPILELLCTYTPYLWVQ